MKFAQYCSLNFQVGALNYVTLLWEQNPVKRLMVDSDRGICMVDSDRGIVWWTLIEELYGGLW